MQKNIWPNNTSVVCSIKDNEKGEALILITDKKNPDLQKLNRFMKDEGFQIYISKKIKFLEEFPILVAVKLTLKNFKILQILNNIFYLVYFPRSTLIHMV